MFPWGSFPIPFSVFYLECNLMPRLINSCMKVHKNMQSISEPMLSQSFVLQRSAMAISVGSSLKRTCFNFQVYLQCGLSLAPVLRRILAMGTLLVMMAISRGVNPSLLGVLRSSSSAVYWYRRICTASMSCCSTASNMASLPWKFWRRTKAG